MSMRTVSSRRCQVRSKREDTNTRLCFSCFLWVVEARGHGAVERTIFGFKETRLNEVNRQISRMAWLGSLFRGRRDLGCET
ncbi:hypothetical protein BJY00DRAFT_287021 [Aspergillus carlsbadensis]|nr:hypothetical protein BJY00DRAFT_287021 [Aspergillus carlsbadensis]